MKKSVLVAVFFSFVAFDGMRQTCVGQTVGGPILTESDGQFTLSFSPGYSKTSISGTNTSSSRFLFKGIYSAANALDVFGEVGIAKLSLESSEAGRPDFKDDFHLALGGGFTFRYLTIRSLHMSLFLSGHVFRFTSNPTSEKNLFLGGSNVSQVVGFEYDWREANANLGFIERVGNVKLYFGANSKVIHRVETRFSRNVIGAGQGSESLVKGEYKSGLKLSPFFGIDIFLPSRHFLSAELIASGPDSFMINLALSQTGRP